MVYAIITHTKLCYQAAFFSGLGQHTSYDWQAMASKLYPKRLACFVVNFPGFCSLILGMVYVCVCMCVAEARTYIFNTFVFSAEVFIYSIKCVHLHRQKCSSSAQNTFVASDKHGRLHAV